MKHHVLIGLGIGSALAFGPLLATRAGEPTQAAKTPWKIAAELEEACSCNGPCPCWFNALPSRMSCDGAQVVFIKKGNYGKVSLDGLAVGQFVKSPEGQTMADSFGKWYFDYVYIDERANDAQRKALQEIASHLYMPGAAKREFRFVSISRTLEGNDHVVTVGQAGNFRGHLTDGGYKGAPKISNPPLADPSHKEFLQGKATKIAYNDAGQKWNFENTNYMFNKFSTDSAEYEKFEAELAKKMEAAKKAMK